MQQNKMKPLSIINGKKPGYGDNKGSITPRHEKSITLYFNEIARHKNSPILTKKEEVELFEEMKNGSTVAKEKLIVSNLKFVVSVAKMYTNQGLPFEDLVNEGNIGLIRALESFETERNIKFFSYAVWWIRQSIMQAIMDKGKMVRIPINKKDSLTRVNKVISKLEQTLERKPTMDEIVEQCEDLNHKEVGSIIRSHLTQTSLDAPFNSNSGEESTLYDILPAEKISYKNRNDELKHEMNDILSKLEPTERSIIEMYYGVLVDRKYTLEEIGVEFDKTRERIRQIKEKALRKLRNNPRIKELFEYTDSE